MNLAPVDKMPAQYTDEERAVIAGFLLHFRSGTLSGLESSNRYAEITTDYGAANQKKFFQNQEQYSRFLLYWAGYPVQKGEMYFG